MESEGHQKEQRREEENKKELEKSSVQRQLDNRVWVEAINNSYI